MTARARRPPAPRLHDAAAEAHSKFNDSVEEEAGDAICIDALLAALNRVPARKGS